MRFASLASVAALVLAAGSARAEDIPNPEFASWSQHKKGTSVTMKSTSEAAGVKSEVRITTTLVEVGTDKVVIETTTVSTINGMEFKVPPMKRDVPKTIMLPEGVKKEDVVGKKPPGTFEEGTETLKIAGGEYKTKWYKYKSEAGGLKTEAKMWMSDDVPGSVVKMESKTTGAVASSMTTELVEFKKP